MIHGSNQGGEGGEEPNASKDYSAVRYLKLPAHPDSLLENPHRIELGNKGIVTRWVILLLANPSILIYICTVIAAT